VHQSQSGRHKERTIFVRYANFLKHRGGVNQVIESKETLNVANEMSVISLSA